MAFNFDSTVLLDARKRTTEKYFKEFENRPLQSDVISMIMESTKAGLGLEQLEAIRKAEQQNIDILFKKKTILETGTSRACTYTGGFADSGKDRPIFVDLTASFSLRESVHKNNEISFLEALSDGYEFLENSILHEGVTSGGAQQNLRSRILADIASNKSSVNALSVGTHKNTWKGTPDFFVEVSKANSVHFTSNLEIDFRLNKYGKNIMLLGNTDMMGLFNQTLNQGAGNSINYAWQGMPMGGFFEDPTIAPATNYEYKAFAFQKGAIAAAFWTYNDKRGIKQLADKMYGTYASTKYPGIVYDMVVEQKCVDTKSPTDHGGIKDDTVITITFILNYALPKVQLSAVGETPIFEYQVKTA